MLLRLFMVCDVPHVRYNGAIVCILIHRQLSGPIRKSSPIHSSTYDQNHQSASISSKSLSHFFHVDADLSASVWHTEFLQHTMHISHDYAKKVL